ncbi:hypothetical protein PCL1606_15110 [Pseudomonas chlororaphis]|uniref:Uncharacterized protein n=1 Tax=Pseudomonas chlororaphis TaxID=587753 RepID=A0A0D5XV35_9PSED|nr:hypothetical protein PCL1606_15110 [Pseudomonas chlororaphis]
MSVNLKPLKRRHCQTERARRAGAFLQAKKNPKILTFVGLSDFKYC